MQRMSLKESVGKFKTSLQMQSWEYIFLAIWLSDITVGCILATLLPVVDRETQVLCNTTGKIENSSAVPPHSRFHVHPLPHYCIEEISKEFSLYLTNYLLQNSCMLYVSSSDITIFSLGIFGTYSESHSLSMIILISFNWEEENVKK